MEPRKDYVITLEGCDDDTEIEIWLTQQDFELIKRVEILSKEKSTYGCMPTLVIEEMEPINFEEE